VRSISLLKVVAEAELLRLQATLKRQGLRIAFGVIAAIFALGLMILCNIAVWQILRWYVEGIYATLILLGVNLLFTVIFAMLAIRSSPSQAERDALRIRRDALVAARGSAALSTLIPIAGTVIRYRRRRRKS
jgi:hypothetical protein